MFEFDPSDGSLTIPAIDFAGGRVEFVFDCCRLDSYQLRWERRGQAFVASGGGTLELAIAPSARGISASATNRGSSAIRLMAVRFEFHPHRLAEAPLAADYMELINMPTFEGMCGVKRVGLPNRWQKANPASSMVYVLHHRATRAAWLFSTLPPHAGDFATFKALHEDAHLEGRFGIEITLTLQCLLEPGKSAATSTVQFRQGDDAIALLSELGKQWQDGLNHPLKPPCLGWNSWDYFAEAFGEQDVLENTQATRELFNVPHPDVMIDGGWDQRWGRWEPTNLFPHGLQWLAAEITRQGGRPGIWVAPTAVNVYTRLYRDHGDWFVRDRSGNILQESYGHGQTVHLDVTHPQVQQWIRELFVRLHGYGFRIFKIDFTQQQLNNAGFYHDGSVPRGAILRKLFEIIRSAIGPDSYLFTCGAPYECATGLADAVRTSADIHNHWSHVLMNATGISTRWWMNRRLWNCDPDMLIVRTPENCPGVPLNRPMNYSPVDYNQLWRSGREFNNREARTYALLVLLAGGDIMFGDHLPALNESGRELLRRIIDGRLSQAAVPVDLFESHEGLPSLWVADEPDHWLIGLFNWEEDPRTVQVDPARLGIAAKKAMRWFWTGEPVEASDGKIAVEIGPRESVAIRIDK